MKCSRFSLDLLAESGEMHNFRKQVIKVARLFWFHMAVSTGQHSSQSSEITQVSLARMLRIAPAGVKGA